MDIIASFDILLQVFQFVDSIFIPKQLADSINALTMENISNPILVEVVGKDGKLLDTLLIFVSVIFGGFISFIFSFWLYKKQLKHSNRKAVFSRIKGFQSGWGQLFVTRYESWMIQDYHDIEFRFLSNEKNKNVEEIQYRRHLIDVYREKGYFFSDKLFQLEQDIAEALGMVEISFNVNDEIQDAIEFIRNVNKYNFKPFDVDEYNLEILDSQLDIRKSDMIRYSHLNHNKSILNLLDLLKPQIKR